MDESQNSTAGKEAVMRIASFNVENLFQRAKVMNQDSWKDGKPVLQAFTRFNTIIQRENYTDATKEELLELLDALGLSRSDESAFVILRQNRGRLVSRPKQKPPQIAAAGRNDWVGWLELKKEAVDETATQMTAKVIRDVEADVLAVVEADDRISLTRFNEQLLKPIASPFNHIMLIDGNDERGIDVGLMTRRGCTIESVVSHVDDIVEGRRVFSRDCPEYTVRTSGGAKVLVLVNHLKSKGHGVKNESDSRRRAQAQRIREIYDQRRAEGIELIAVLGDLNDTPQSDPMVPLLRNGSDLQDISLHPRFVGDGRPGTYANGTESNKLDYILLSPALAGRVGRASVHRLGVWGGKHGTLFDHYPEMTSPVHAASDHAALWAEIDL
jgi:endonuclease/exonuclease/phosphatase family metal-dependent hydrolase